MGRGRKPCLTPEQVNYLVAEYQRGRTAPNIAQELGVSKGSAINYLKAAGVERRHRVGAPKLVTLELVQAAKGMREQMIPWKTIVRKLGVCESVLYDGIKRMEKGEPV